MSTLASPRPAAAAGKEHEQQLKTTRYPDYGQTPGRRHFWLRRVHSLAGLVFGGYITVHLLVNATGLWPKVYQENVDHIHTLEPMLPLVELLAIFAPLLIHMIYGAYIGAARVKFNTTKYNYGGNVRYALQRWTAYILLAFLVYHVGTLHRWGFAAIHLQDVPAFNPKNVAYQTTVTAIKSPYDSQALNVAVMAFYLLGVWSAVFHWANGLWTSAIAWGLTTTAQSQRRWGHVCLGFGIVMLVVGTVAWAAFTIDGRAGLDIEKTRTLPDAIAEQVHAQATGGKQTSSPIPSGEVPGVTGPATGSAH